MLHVARTLVLLALVVLLQAPLVRSAVAQTGPTGGEQVTVVEVDGSERLLVKSEAGPAFRVQYIGLRGPLRSSQLHEAAAEFHRPLVAGQRVRLETDGLDEEGGYKLRHVYRDGEASPVGAAVLTAGWAVAVPYPLNHRHRGLYLQAQEQAIAAQANLWQPDRLAPVAVWRPAGSTESGYLPADPALHPALDLLNTVPTGQSVVSRLLRTAPVLLTRDLPENAGGFTEPYGFHIEVNRKLVGLNPRVLAVVIAHEGTHAIDFAASATDRLTFACFEIEQRAFTIESKTWAEFYGPEGMPGAKENWERAENEILRFAQRGDLEGYVRRSSAYELQCSRDGLPR